jgi:hypothetical protein
MEKFVQANDAVISPAGNSGIMYHVTDTAQPRGPQDRRSNWRTTRRRAIRNGVVGYTRYISPRMIQRPASRLIPLNLLENGTVSGSS